MAYQQQQQQQQQYQQPQGGYQQQQAPQGGYQQQQQQGGQQGGQQRTNSGFDNHAKIQFIGRLTKDPESKIIGSSKVASSKIAVNHRSEKAGTDYWFIEVWGNEGADSKHNFLVNHCPKGRRVFIEGTPELRQVKNADGTYSYFPTIKATEIIGLDGGNKDGAAAGGQQQQAAPPSGQYSGSAQQQYQPAPPQQQYQQAPPQQQYQQAPPQQQQQYQQAPPALVGAGAPAQGGFPPNPPGGFGAPMGAPAGAPNNGGFPPAPPQR